MKVGDLVKLGWFYRSWRRSEHDGIGMIIKIKYTKDNTAPHDKIQCWVHWSSGIVEVFDKGALYPFRLNMWPLAVIWGPSWFF